VHRPGLAEFLVGQVAHGDNEITGLPDVVNMAGPQPGQRQVVPLGDGDRAGIDRCCRMCSGLYRRSTRPSTDLLLQTTATDGLPAILEPGSRLKRSAWLYRCRAYPQTRL